MSYTGAFVMKVTGRPSASSSTQTQLGQGSPFIRNPGAAHPMGVLLFGKRPPRLVDWREHPRLRKALRKLSALKEQIAELAGQSPDELSIALCEGGNASISRQGQISVGVELLERHGGDDDLLVAMLGHEIGHQPWTWPEGDLSHLSRKELDALYREEEAKADRFAGRVLADLGGNPGSICKFLLEAHSLEARPPSDYYPAPQRAQLIQQTFARRSRTLRDALAHYPELAARARDLR